MSRRPYRKIAHPLHHPLRRVRRRGAAADRSTRSDGRFVPVEGQPGLLVDPLTGARYRATGNGLLYIGRGSSNGRTSDFGSEDEGSTPSPRANGIGLRPVHGEPGVFVDTATGERIGLEDMRLDDVSPKPRRFGCQWVAPWDIDWPLRSWAFAWATDTESWFVRILGVELSLRKEP